MIARKIKISKDWLNESPKHRSTRMPKVIQLAVEDVLKIEDLPELITAEDAAKRLNLSKECVAAKMRSGELMSTKIGRSRVTTPQWIALFIQAKMGHG